MRPWSVLAGLATASAALGCSSSPSPHSVGPLLAPPPQGKGFQLTTGDFDVEAGSEVQACYFYKVSDLAKAHGYAADQPLILHRTEIAYKDGSHHMNIFRVRTIKELDPAKGAVQVSVNANQPCAFSQNWSDWPLIANNQDPGYFNWQYPDGVGNELMPDETIMLQSHYVNATTQRTDDGARVDVNFWTMTKSELKFPMGTVFAQKQSIRICKSNPSPKFSGTCQIKSPTQVHIIGANGHFHSRGREFAMYTWDGKTPMTPPDANKFYSSNEWDEPPMKISPELDATPPVGGGIWYTCSYKWTPPPLHIGCDGLNKLDKELFGTPDSALDCCYTFGNTVDRAEHCNVFAYYYPKQDDVNCF